MAAEHFPALRSRSRTSGLQFETSKTVISTLEPTPETLHKGRRGRSMIHRCRVHLYCLEQNVGAHRYIPLSNETTSQIAVAEFQNRRKSLSIFAGKFENN